jgi:hypothetical protein
MRSLAVLSCCALLLSGLGIVGACQNPTPSSVPLGGVDEAPREPTDKAEAKADRRDKKRAGKAEADSEKEESEDETESEGEDEKEDGEEAAGGAKNGDDEKESSKKAKSASLSLPNAASSTTLAGRDVPPLCDDSKPATLNCRPLSERCPPLTPICTTIESTFKPKVGQAIVDCASKKECGVAQFECLRPALRKACVDDKAKSFCEEREKACRREYKKAEVSRQDCEYGLASLLPDVRAGMEACMSESCDVRACIARILPTPVSDDDEGYGDEDE